MLINDLLLFLSFILHLLSIMQIICMNNGQQRYENNLITIEQKHILDRYIKSLGGRGVRRGKFGEY